MSEKLRRYSAIVTVVAEFRVSYDGTGELGFLEMSEAASLALNHALGAASDGTEFSSPEFPAITVSFLDSTPHDVEYEELDEDEQKPRGLIEF
jgi:hypothetical protein